MRASPKPPRAPAKSPIESSADDPPVAELVSSFNLNTSSKDKRLLEAFFAFLPALSAASAALLAPPSILFQKSEDLSALSSAASPTLRISLAALPPALYELKVFIRREIALSELFAFMATPIRTTPSTVSRPIKGCDVRAVTRNSTAFATLNKTAFRAEIAIAPSACILKIAQAAAAEISTAVRILITGTFPSID